MTESNSPFNQNNTNNNQHSNGVEINFTGKTMSVDQFKSHFGVTSVEVIKNPKTGKLFVSNPQGGAFACVSQHIKAGDDVQFSEFINSDGQPMNMLCRKGQGLTPIMTF